MNQKLKEKLDSVFKACDEVFWDYCLETEIKIDESYVIQGIYYKINQVLLFNVPQETSIYFKIDYLSDDIIEKIIDDVERKISRRLSKKAKFEDNQYCDAL